MDVMVAAPGRGRVSPRLRCMSFCFSRRNPWPGVQALALTAGNT